MRNWKKCNGMWPVEEPGLARGQTIWGMVAMQGSRKQFGSGTAILCGDNRDTHICTLTSLSYP